MAGVREEEQAAVLALVRATESEWHRTAGLIAEAGSALRLLGGGWTGLETFDTRLADALAARVDAADIDRARTLIDDLARDGVRTVTVLDDGYPVNLRLIYNLPPFLFVRGDLVARDNRAIAVVGTRQATATGLEQARALASELARNGVTVIAGLARGIDTAAHEAALEAGGHTIAVLGQGLQTPVYPRDNTALASRITAHGALVSQFWPDAPPTSFRFPMRNVVTSGISAGTVVIEASATSGAKMQARLALEHGKRVFLVRSLVMEQDWARRYVAERGAIAVDSVTEILSTLVTLSGAPQQLTLV